MCRDGYRAECVSEDCTNEVRCRDHTLCEDCRVGTEQEYW